MKQYLLSIRRRNRRGFRYTELVIIDAANGYHAAAIGRKLADGWHGELQQVEAVTPRGGAA